MQLYVDCKKTPWRAEAIQSWPWNVRICQTYHELMYGENGTLIFQRGNFVILCPPPHSATLPSLLRVLQCYRRSQLRAGLQGIIQHLFPDCMGAKWRACPSHLRKNTVVSACLWMLDNLTYTSCGSSSLLPTWHHVSIERYVQMQCAQHLGKFEFIGIYTVWQTSMAIEMTDCL